MKRFESIHSYKTTCICKFHFSLHAILQTRVDVVKSSMMMMRSEWRAKFPAHVLAASCNLNESEQVLNKKILIIMALSFLSVNCKSIAKQGRAKVWWCTERKLHCMPPPPPNSSIEECEKYRYSKTTFPDLCHVQKDYATKVSSQVRITKRKKLYKSGTTSRNNRKGLERC